jgi:hypothetical protein
MNYLIDCLLGLAVVVVIVLLVQVELIIKRVR